MLLEQIRADSLTARKNRDSAKAVLLTTLFSEAAMKGKNAGNRDTTDAEVCEVIAKFIKGIDQSLAVVKDDVRVKTLQAEKEVLESYLPKAATLDEVQKYAQFLVFTLTEPGPKSMGLVMKGLKEHFGASLDGTMASSVVKQLLTP